MPNKIITNNNQYINKPGIFEYSSVSKNCILIAYLNTKAAQGTAAASFFCARKFALIYYYLIAKKKIQRMGRPQRSITIERWGCALIMPLLSLMLHLTKRKGYHLHLCEN